MFLRSTIIRPGLCFLVLLLSSCAREHRIELNEDTISFYYLNERAQEVLFASSIDGYNYHPAREAAPGNWQVTVPREHEFTYFYKVDGMITVPPCRLTVVDDFGARNCLFSADM
jgi:hypothetical protein